MLPRPVKQAFADYREASIGHRNRQGTGEVCVNVCLSDSMGMGTEFSAHLNAKLPERLSDDRLGVLLLSPLR